MLYYVKSHKKFKILDTFNELLCYCSFALRHSIVYCKQSTENRHISSISCADKSLKSQHIFMCLFNVFWNSLCWSEKVFCLEDVGILHRGRKKICIFKPFPAYGKVDANQKIFYSRYELLLEDQNCVLYSI